MARQPRRAGRVHFMRAITLLSNSNVQATCNISLAVFEQELSSVMIPEHLKILADSPNFIAVFANVKSMLEAYLTNDHSFAKASEEMPLVADPGTPAIDVAQRQQEPPYVAEALTPITGSRLGMSESVRQRPVACLHCNGNPRPPRNTEISRGQTSRGSGVHAGRELIALYTCSREVTSMMGK